MIARVMISLVLIACTVTSVQSASLRDAASKKLQADAAALARAGASGSDSCSEEKKLKAELNAMQDHEPGYYKKYNAAEKAEEECEKQKAAAAHEKANEETHEAWTEQSTPHD
eukprot:gnl/TRDRNA2_/TRDRNA2_41073_c0_seq1.p2 gnl/TRDRNA2_/TRDRNA2_41073_c0~~gnl/TRDRNA2_/TRDRNA2_41073_c0_seq1.p2  ORF type:complete len:113 (-),score=34.92 gnl/TRDRNA2_/TRDRNA2_41073_c0_seq1:83-421(-)